MPRPKGSAQRIEARRHRALRLLDEGYSLNEVGRMVESAPSSVMRWRDARQRGGDAALRVRLSPGRPPALTTAQRRRIVKRLLKGARANGFATELWTTPRVASLIEKHCRVQFHRSHVARLLHDLGFSCQKPERRALERGSPRVKKTLRGWVPTSTLSTSPAAC